MMQAFTGSVRGRVQGVGYRYFTERAAWELSIRGWVRNRPDGSVEVLAVGEASDLDQFLTRLKQGPPASRVESIDVDWLKDPPQHDQFLITG